MVAPDAVTFVCLLQACANMGVSALEQGKLLHSEIKDRDVKSDVVLGGSLVHMYAKCGSLRDARIVFEGLHVKDVVTWNAMMAGYAEQEGMGDDALSLHSVMRNDGMVVPDAMTFACLLKACANLGVSALDKSAMIAGYAHEHLVNLQPAVATAYALLGNIYANAGRWEEVEKVEMLRKNAGARKKAAIACIEVRKEVHKFTVGEERSDIAVTLRKMNAKVQEGGHVPQTQLVLRANVSEQEKEDALCGHAEKLALAYGLLNTPAGSTLLVTKNHRMCQ